MKEKWNERYNTNDYFYGEKANDFLVESAHFISPNSNILCLAEGEGRNAVFLAKLGHNVTAVDMSEIGINKALNLAKKNNVSINTIIQNLDEFIIEPDRWDAVISIWCHLPSKLRSKIHSLVESGLKHNGLFILEAYTPEQLKYKTGGPDNHDLLMTKEKLSSELKNLHFLHLEEKIRDIQEGVGHRGTSAVVQVVAKKISK